MNFIDNSHARFLEYSLAEGQMLLKDLGTFLDAKAVLTVNRLYVDPSEISFNFSVKGPKDKKAKFYLLKKSIFANTLVVVHNGKATPVDTISFIFGKFL